MPAVAAARGAGPGRAPGNSKSQSTSALAGTAATQDGVWRETSGASATRD